MHLPDIFLFKPIYQGGQRLAFAATICHHTDVGGRVAGSNASDSTEIYQEGLRIPPLKLYAAGARNQTLFDLIEANVRMPVKVFGDLRAQLAACHIAERQFLELVARYGADAVRDLMAARDRPRRAADARGAARAARRPVELRGLDRRRRRRAGKTDPAVRDHDQAGRADAGRLDRHRPAGQGRDQQHLFLHQGRELYRDPLGAAGGHPEQRGRVPRDRGDRTARARSPTACCRPPARRAA